MNVDVTINGGVPELSVAGTVVQTSTAYSGYDWYDAPWARWPGSDYTQRTYQGEGILLSAVPALGWKFRWWNGLRAHWTHEYAYTPMSADTQTSSVSPAGPTEYENSDGDVTQNRVMTYTLGYPPLSVNSWHFEPEEDLIPTWTGPTPEYGFTSPNDMGLTQRYYIADQYIGSGNPPAGELEESTWTWTPISVNCQFQKCSITVRFFGTKMDGEEQLLTQIQGLTWNGPGMLSAMHPLNFGGQAFHSQDYGIDLSNYYDNDIAEVQGWATDNGYVLQEGIDHWLPQPGTELAEGLYQLSGEDFVMDLHAQYRTCTSSLIHKQSTGLPFVHTSVTSVEISGEIVWLSSSSFLVDGLKCHGLQPS